MWVGVLAAALATGCYDTSNPLIHDDGETPQAFAVPAAPSLNYTRTAYLDFFFSPDQYVESTGEVEFLFDDGGTISRCPDEQRLNHPRGVVLTGRTLIATAKDLDDPDERLIHFAVDATTLRFLHYEQMGWPVSFARYALSREVISSDLRYAAPYGATVRLRCFRGRYVGPRTLRTYAGQLRIEGISPVFGTTLGGGGDCDDFRLVISPDYNPYDPAGPDTCKDSGPGGGSSGDDGEVGGSNCKTEYIVIEISYDDGETWSVWWEGYAKVCE